MNTEQQNLQNLMLSTLPAEDFKRLQPLLHLVSLPLGEEIEKPNEKLSHAYFLESGVASTIAQMSRGRDIEVGVIGNEGFVGSSLVYWDTQGPFKTYIQIPGAAHRIETDHLMDVMDEHISIRRHFAAFARALSLQVVSTAWTNGHAILEQRLARWLLMVHDRVEGNKLGLTHEFLSIMLGVRRPGVTVALHMLEGKALIRSNRSEIIILDRTGLKALSNGSYGKVETEYKRLIGWHVR